MIHVRARSVGEAWITVLQELVEKGRRGPCQWQDRRAECIWAPLALEITEPLSEPRFHMGGIQVPRLIYTYRQEVLFGLHDEYVGRGWSYAYHQRLFDHSHLGCQVGRMMERLRKVPYTRRAVAVTWDRDDHYSETPPCIMYIWAHVEDGRLDFHCHMRSNDWLKAALYDIDAMVELMRQMARDLDVEVGAYRHFVDHCHIYLRSDDLRLLEVALKRPDAYLTSDELRRLARAGSL